MTDRKSEPKSEPKRSTKPAPVRLGADYWDEDGNRHRKGATVALPTAEARELLTSGKAERADPLPGEDDEG